jgi:hypothetical protein
VKATIPCLAAVVLGLAAAVPVRAGWDVPCCPPQRCFVPQAPDACGPGYYAPNVAGQWYGPNYAIHPPYLPFNGMVLPPKAPGGGGLGGGGMGPGGAGGFQAFSFPTHPYARGPRDFFMVD